MPQTTAIQTDTACHHCGESCPDHSIRKGDYFFCCDGCKMVYEILEDNNLCTYYDIEAHPGVTIKKANKQDRFAYLDDPTIQHSLINFRRGEEIRVQFYLPQIHCASCIWLLENLYRLHPGVLKSEVNFLRKEINIVLEEEQISLREAVELLSSIGYEPLIQLESADAKEKKRIDTPFFLKLGVAGFCFGNIMLFSFPEYLGLIPEVEAGFSSLFSWLNLILAIPVVFYSSTLFFIPAWKGIQQRVLNLDVPISLGILTIFIRSIFDILTQAGPGYLDSLAGLVFFLLIGKWFQRKSFDSIRFDRDYTSYFPLSTSKLTKDGEKSVSVTQLAVGDKLIIRNQELIPADAILLSEKADIDYSFVTGESKPVDIRKGELVYAGGRQCGPAIELIVEKEVSQSYLIQLWNQGKEEEPLSTNPSFVDRLSHYFTPAIILIALGAGLFWGLIEGWETALMVFTSVLIVACPCGLALTSPIILGNTMRWMGKLGLYLQSPFVLEKMSHVDSIVFDKTGTLTYKAQTKAGQVEGDFSSYEASLIKTLASQSGHPVSKSISLQLKGNLLDDISDFQEHAGKGIEAYIEGQFVRIGSTKFAPSAEQRTQLKSGTHFWVNGQYKGSYTRSASWRKGIFALLKKLKDRYKLSMISGDALGQAEELRPYFSSSSDFLLEQSPMDKKEYIKGLKSKGDNVLMIGDGLNDAGALAVADVGIALSESAETFSPACKGILEGKNINMLDTFLDWSRESMSLIRWGFGLSLAYNLVGLAFAITGNLSPLVAAILMPVSSVSVVTFGMLATEIKAQKLRSSFDQSQTSSLQAS
ncbi:MAG: heavy metal translocating P-type ATPase metal-binding domain-containing protein [Bacteroidota bacterium]